MQNISLDFFSYLLFSAMEVRVRELGKNRCRKSLDEIPRKEEIVTKFYLLFRHIAHRMVKLKWKTFLDSTTTTGPERRDYVNDSESTATGKCCFWAANKQDAMEKLFRVFLREIEFFAPPLETKIFRLFSISAAIHLHAVVDSGEELEKRKNFRALHGINNFFLVLMNPLSPN